MKKLFLLSVFLCVLCGSGFSQNLTTISAANIQDLNGSKLATGQMCFLGTDQSDNPISFGIGGGGQALRRGYCSAVTAGVVASFTVPNPAFTLPTGIYYRVTVKDSSTGQEVLRYAGVTFAGATFNFDNYQPLIQGASLAPLTGNSVSGNLAVTGNVAATGTVNGSNIPAGQINTGTGTTNTLPKFTTGASGIVGNSSISDNGTTVSTSESVTVGGAISAASVTSNGADPWFDVKDPFFGAKGDGVTDDTAAIQNAINFACTGTSSAPVNATCSMPAEVFIPPGTYKTTACLQTYGVVSIVGVGRQTSVIAKSNHANCVAGSIAAPSRALNDNYAVDAIIAIVHPTSAYAYHWKISGVGLRNSGTASTYGIFSPRASQFELSNSYISNVGTGFYANDDWLGTIRHTTVDTAQFGYRWANDGSNNGTGTTMTFDNVWATQIALSCYNIFGLQYSSFNNTACDVLNASNADNANIDLSYAAYGFNTSSNITLNGAGAEVIHGTVLSSQASTLSITAMRALAVTGYTSASGGPAYILCTTFGSVDLNGSTFDAMTSPGSFFNLLTQNGCMLTHKSTLLPLGGSTFNSFGGSSAIVGMNSGVITLSNASGVTTINPNGASYAGHITPTLNGSFNLGDGTHGWLSSFIFRPTIMELTAPSGVSNQHIFWASNVDHFVHYLPNNSVDQRIAQTLQLTAQYTNATTGFTTVGTPNISWAVAANTSYTATCHLYYQAAATGGLNIQFTGPASPTSVTYGLNLPVSASAFADSVATAFGTSLGSVVTTATTNFDAIVSLSLVNGANAGTVTLQAKSSAAAQLQIQAGSFCQVQ